MRKKAIKRLGKYLNGIVSSLFERRVVELHSLPVAVAQSDKKLVNRA